MEQSDEALIALYKKSQNPELISILFKRYTQLVLGVCLNILKDKEASKDALMDIFERMFELLKEQEIQTFKPWLYTVTRNYCLKNLKSLREFSTFENERFQDYFVEFADESALIHEEKENILQAALSNLKYGQKECVSLFYLDERSYSDIEILTGYSNNEVKSFIQNGKRNLKILLEKRRFNFVE